MSKGELLTRATVWVALGGYTVGAALLLIARRGPEWWRSARWAWTTGCIALITHIICAYHYYHSWSHDSAYRETARQTAEVVGADWGGGLYINFALLAGWIADVCWWWRGSVRYDRHSRLLIWVWHSFLIFIIFNATVVFKTGVLRWIGLALCLGLGILWMATRRTARGVIR
jgi:hypothetical protein